MQGNQLTTVHTAPYCTVCRSTKGNDWGLSLSQQPKSPLAVKCAPLPGADNFNKAFALSWARDSRTSLSSIHLFLDALTVQTRCDQSQPVFLASGTVGEVDEVAAERQKNTVENWLTNEWMEEEGQRGL